MTSRGARHPQSRYRASGPAPAARSRRAAAATQSGPGKLRVLGFLVVVGAVLAGGLYFATNFMFASPPNPAASGAIDLGISMDGFSPKEIDARPGQVLTFNWWNSDEAMHLTNGVHTLVSDALGVDFSLPAQSRETITITAPKSPGEYDFWCDSCCGGKDNPQMHARLVVQG